MTTLLVDSNSVEAQSFIDFARTLPFVKTIETKETKPAKNIYQVATTCNATTVDVFFDELDNRIKNRFCHV